MTTIAYLDPVGGISGDMLLAALLDAGADRAAVGRTIEALGLEGVAVTIERVERGGLGATRVGVGVVGRVNWPTSPCSSIASRARSPAARCVSPTA